MNYEYSGVIKARDADELAKVVLPCLDAFELTKGQYRFTLHDDGDHLYIEFFLADLDSLWFEDVGNG